MSSMNYSLGAYYPVNTQYGGYAANNQRFLGSPVNVPITNNQYLYGSSYQSSRYNPDSTEPAKQDTTNTLLKLLLNVLTDKNETESNTAVATDVATVTTPDKVETTSVNKQNSSVKDLLISKLLTMLTNKISYDEMPNKDADVQDDLYSDPYETQSTSSPYLTESRPADYPRSLSDPLGGQIPTNNAVIQGGLFGNFHGTTSILSRYIGDTMPTDKDAPGYTWKYTLPSQNEVTNTNQTQDNSNTSVYPRPLSDPLGGQIPTHNAVVQDGLFGNIRGVQSILSRYVGDTMPTDKDAPGYTWKYTLPGAY